ncbi:MAG TPA: hypothetical protein PK725_10280, partial [Rhodocyclaceae bacterium]|nr:hypothetical protein [Rhodocyclaceae bacterium]
MPPDESKREPVDPDPEAAETCRMPVQKNSHAEFHSALREGPRGRGTGLRPDSRFARQQRECIVDDRFDDASGATATELFVDSAKAVITFNRSPDVP